MIEHWAWRWFPELERVDRGDRWRLWRAAYTPILRRPTYWLIAVATQIGAQWALVAPTSRLARTHGFYRPWMQWLLPLVVAALACYVIIWLMRWRITRNLREELNRRSLPTCMNCGYNLTGNTSGTCPECGKRTRSAQA